MASKEYINTPSLPASPTIDRLFPPMEEASTLLLSCLPSDYSASRIARAVEDCDAHLVNLNVTTDGAMLDNRVVCELRVSHRNPSSVARSLERYGYEVVDTDARSLASDAVAGERLAELLHYLEI
ncbi:MAG: hypothetical protein K2H88_00040 [Duncaniella sp.]|nr:hypothetical protein [Duncaniella sp.]MDE5751010.1 hypothetical protein [Duncaniella sp.]MDE5917901.1 hypothetical protein [Duncaniella sp.]MDE6169845.1 hypothetical protein [Duncaniella sp.]MDE6327469.1 hypothetical protein [Duncaniella sp.]